MAIATHRHSQVKRAMKKILKTVPDQTRPVREIEIMMMLDHPHIIKVPPRPRRSPRPIPQTPDTPQRAPCRYPPGKTLRIRPEPRFGAAPAEWCGPATGAAGGGLAGGRLR